jgi:hypothetical protein
VTYLCSVYRQSGYAGARWAQRDLRTFAVWGVRCGGVVVQTFSVSELVSFTVVSAGFLFRLSRWRGVLWSCIGPRELARDGFGRLRGLQLKSLSVTSSLAVPDQLTVA